MNKLTFLTLGFLLSFSLYGQEISSSKNSFLDKYSTFKNSSGTLDHEAFLSAHSSEMGLSELDEFRLFKTEKARGPYMHYRYKQYHQDLPVYGSSYILHELHGKVVSANGQYLPKLELSVQPELTGEQALSYAMDDMAAEIYTWEVKTEDQRKSHQKPIPELVIIDEKLPNYSGNYKLVYKIDLRSQVPLDGQSYFIDALTGRVVKKISLHHEHGVPGSGKTKYYGEREFIVDSLAPAEFVLHDPTRCTHGITVFDNGQTPFTSTSNRFDLENEDQDEVALDAHYITAEMYDRLRDDFDWLGIDNDDGSMNVAIHANGGRDWVNAFWDGEFAWFGDGDCNNGPLTTCEVLAHEFMHGIIDNTSQLIYSDESGAINESLADVIGHYMENELDPDNFSWSLGHSFQLRDGLDPFRVMDDPNQAGDPEYYQGPLWEDGADVHYNSALGNLVYVMLSDGKEGINQDDVPYEVTGIGRAEAAKFIFYVNRYYLTPSSNYDAYYEACLLASDEYFAGNPDMKENIIQAWTAVGIPGGVVVQDNLNISISSSGYVESCNWGGYGAAEFTVTNRGSEPYLATSLGYVTLEANLGGTNYERRIDLTEDILVGEEQSFTIDSFVLLNDNAFFLDYNLEVGAFNQGQEFTSDFFVVTEFAENDLSIFVSQPEVSCFQSKHLLTFSVINESCVEKQAGEKVRISLEDDFGSEVWSEEIVLNDNILPERAIQFERELDLNISETSFYQVVIENASDPNLDNNSSFAVVTVYETLEINYFNWFDTEEDLTNGLSFQTNNFFGGSNIAPHQGSTQFYTTGISSEAFGPLCVNPEDDWSEITFGGNISAQFDACLDLEGADNPAIHFEMTQYRNDFMDFASEQSSSVRLTTIEDGVETHQIIGGLAEGEKEIFDIPLSANFKGSMSLQFLTQTGVDFFATDFLLHDVIFMENLALINTSSTDKVFADNTLELFPNPVNERLYFSNDVQYDNLTVIDVSGKEILRLKSANTTSLDVSNFDPGYYMVQLLSKAGEKFQGKFIKL